MEPIDPYLYVALAGGWLVGRVWRPPPRVLGRATLAAVLVLVGLLGDSFRAIPPGSMLSTLPLSAAFCASVVAASLGAVGLIHAVRPPAPSEARTAAEPVRDRVPTAAVVLGAVIAGYLVGRAAPIPAAGLLPWALYALLGLVGLGLQPGWKRLGRAWVPILASVAGALLAAAAFSTLGFPSRAAFASALGFGWYSLAGPLVAARFGATLGLFAFLANFLRELATMLLAPAFGRRLRSEALTTIGGATAMDTTLYFVVRYGDDGGGALPLASGLALTVAASLLVPLVLAL